MCRWLMVNFMPGARRIAFKFANVMCTVDVIVAVDVVEIVPEMMFV